MTRADGTACALLPVFPPGFPDGVLSPRPADPRGSTLPCLLLSTYTYSVRSTCAAAQQRVHAHVCSCYAIREMKFKQYTADPPRRRVGSEIAYNDAFKIYSINRCLGAVQPYPLPLLRWRTLIFASPPRESSRDARAAIYDILHVNKLEN